MSKICIPAEYYKTLEEEFVRLRNAEGIAEIKSQLAKLLRLVEEMGEI